MNKLVNNLLYTLLGIAMMFLFNNGNTIILNWVFLAWLLMIVLDVD